MEIVAGLDGGGTKTAVTVADASGQILAEFAAGPINPNGTTDESVRNTILSIFSRLERAYHADTVCVCSAGVCNPDTVAFLKAAVKDSGFTGKFLLLGDQVGALYGAAGKPYGAVLIAGTGSICYGRTGAGEKRTGGQGYLIDDFGSGYMIGRDILSAVVKAYDGRAEATALTEPVFDKLGLDVNNIGGLIQYVYDQGTNKRDIAAFSKALPAALEKGDEAALHIARRCVRELLLLASPVIAGLGLEEDTLYISGGVFKDDWIREHFRAALTRAYPRIACCAPKFSASFGAVLAAIDAGAPAL